MRPVRLEPCAPGARSRIRIRAWGSPKEGTGCPQYSQSRKARRFTAAMRSQCSRKRGQRRQLATSFCRICKISSTGLFNGRMIFGCSGRLSVICSGVDLCRSEPRVVMKTPFLVAFVIGLLAGPGAHATIQHPRKRRHTAAAAPPRAAAAPIVRVATQTPRPAPAPAAVVIRGGPWTEPTYADSTVGDMVDGEDLVIRRAAVGALGPYNGSVVAVDP